VWIKILSALHLRVDKGTHGRCTRTSMPHPGYQQSTSHIIINKYNTILYKYSTTRMRRVDGLQAFRRVWKTCQAAKPSTVSFMPCKPVHEQPLDNTQTGTRYGLAARTHLRIQHLHWVGSAGNGKDRRVEEVRRELFRIEGGRGDDKLEVRALAADLMRWARTGAERNALGLLASKEGVGMARKSDHHRPHDEAQPYRRAPPDSSPWGVSWACHLNLCDRERNACGESDADQATAPPKADDERTAESLRRIRAAVLRGMRSDASCNPCLQSLPA
jgi:hypothetical protein